MATAEGTKALIDAGADCVKVGIGPGSICTTRVVAGIGVPQITAVYDAATEASKHGIPVIADGGIKYSGDIVKALAAGGAAVMLGSMVAGCAGGPRRVRAVPGPAVQGLPGHGQPGRHGQGQRRPVLPGRAEEVRPRRRRGPGALQGPPWRIPCSSCWGGLRSGMGYTGCANIQELHDKAQFVKITGAGLRESHPHDIQITKEAPNYTYHA